MALAIMILEKGAITNSAPRGMLYTQDVHGQTNYNSILIMKALFGKAQFLT